MRDNIERHRKERGRIQYAKSYHYDRCMYDKRYEGPYRRGLRKATKPTGAYVRQIRYWRLTTCRGESG
jgi:hypothetical protein